MSIATMPLRRRGRLPDALLMIRAAAIVLAVGLLGLGCLILGSGNEVGEAARESLRIAELHGRITYLNEVIAGSARTGVWSRDPRWRQRFDDLAPSLDKAIAEATALANPELRSQVAGTLGEAHRDLRMIERRAFTSSDAGNAAGAQTLLDSASYHYLQEVFRSGLDGLGQYLKREAETRTSLLSRRSWLRTCSFGLMAILFVMALMAAQHRIRLRAAACIDPLTQLPNRRQLYVHLAAMLEHGSDAALDRLALVVIGIDHFKAINDSFGHATADFLLQGVAGRLHAAVPLGTFMARVGGDEFAVLTEVPQPGPGDDGPFSRLMTALAEPYRLDDGRDIRLSVSAGAVWVTKDNAVGDVMRQAGAALRQAKQEGRGCLRIFDQAMDARARDRALLEADLRLAIDRGEIVPFFQPLVDLSSGRTMGVEALARWHHDERGWVSPATFIPMAEELGLIDDLMERMLRQACRAARHWPAHVTVAFNVSPLQLRNDALPRQIRAIMAETGFPARRLEIEVTESALVTDLGLARRLLEDLRASGVRLALDDFGTGYSSLKHLRCLPFDKLKIDASFVGGMVDDRESGKIVAAVVGLGHSLGLSTVAEGVETLQVAKLLQELGCDFGQGWLFGRPVPAASLSFGDEANEQAA